MASINDRMVWIDLEMTGLDPRTDVILEIATVITTYDLRLVAEGPSLVLHQPPEVMERMGSVVRAMHEKNGLTLLVRQSRISPREAEQETLRFIKQHCRPRESPICGNSIWTDRMFVSLQMESIHRYLHHRVIDVSSIKELAERWYPAARRSSPQKPESHRALDDIRASIEELRHYRECFFQKPSLVD